jgi:NCAIR mutase (PurE)-related protein
MSEDELRRLFLAVRAGEVEIDQAIEAALPSGVADLGFASMDLGRRERCGFPEVIFCQGKLPEWVEGAVRALADAGQDCLATRVDDAQAARLADCFPQGQQDRVARTFWLPAGQQPEPAGYVLVLTAGTSDLPVAREAFVTLQAMGAGGELVADVGVAGIHRLFRHREKLTRADAVIVVAGMDGALPSVVGGLARCPVIAVPTSIGYGASFGGLAALLTMLNACSAGVVTVNIDAGFKAGYTAALIARGSAAGRPKDGR